MTLFLGLRVYFADKQSLPNRSFLIFSLFVVLWLLLDFSLYQFSLSDFQTFLNRLNLSNICIMVFSLSYFVTVFPREIPKIPKWLFYIFLTITILLALYILLSNKIVDRAFMEDYGSNFDQGSNFFIFAVFASLFALYSITVLIYKFFKFKDLEKKQIKYILYGIAFFAILNLLFNLFVPIVTKSFRFARFGTYSAIFFIGFTAYAILKTHIFNLRIILTESALVIINVIAVVQIFTSASTLDALLQLLFAVFIFYGSYLLLQSVRREIKFREELQVMTEQLAQANAHLKELDAMKTEFVSLASHELLTPVSAIEGYLSMLLDEKMAKLEDPKAVKYMDRVYSSAKRLARLVTDMLNVSRIEEGRLLVEKKEIDLSKLINEVIDEIKFKAEENKQEIAFENPDGWNTFGDPDKVKEVVVNLIGNSIKYSKNPGTITVKVEKVPTAQVAEKWQKVEAEIKARPLDDQEAIKSAVDEHFHALVGPEQLLISVKDQGIGIPKEELPRLFKKFHRVGDFTTAESQGTGLGLYISRALVELHHGRIWADSEGPSHGSTFTFSLPTIESKDELLKMEAQAPKTKEALKPLARPVKQAEEL